MSKTDRAVIVYGNDTHLHIQMYRFDKAQGKYVDFDMTEVSDLVVYLICSKHSTNINLDYTINDAYHNIIDCFIDYRLLHTNASYGVVVEGNYNDEHFRYEELPSELMLVIPNTSGLKVTDDVNHIDLSARVGWGISVGDLSQYYTKNETEQYVQDELEDYYDKTETNALLDEKANSADLATVATTGSYNDLINKPVIPAGQIQSDWSQTNPSEVDYIKNKPNLATVATSGNYNDLNHKPDLSIYATEQELGNYYDKGETDGLLNNKVDTSTLVNDYYNKNTVDNLLDTKADTSDLNNYYDKTETNSLLNQKANTSDLNNKQDTLVSGENIKTVNNQSILGSGNIDIQVSQVQANWTETDASDPSYIQNKPNLATVATSGSYNDLTNTPNLATVATSGDYDDLTNKPNLSQYATQTDLAGKQDTLVSGTNIKTINNQSLLGSGNIDIQGGGGENHDNADEATANALYELNERLSEAEINIDIIPTEVQAKMDELEANVEQSLDELPPKFDEIDEEFKSTALVIEELHETAQPTLVSGTNIKTINNESILGSGNITISGGGVQSNWNETDTTSLAYIQNKPTIQNPGFIQYTNPNYSTRTGLINSLSTNYNTNIGKGAVIEGTKDPDSSEKIEASGQFSHAEGGSTKASAQYSHAEGYTTTSSNYYAHAEGYVTTSSGMATHAEGQGSQATNEDAHAEGYYTTASGKNSHAEGRSTTASGLNSHAEGYYTTASGESTHAEGCYTLAQNNYEHASGRYNNSTKTNTTFGDNGNTLFSVGNGNNTNNKHNAIEIRQNGDLYIADTNNTTYSNYYEKPMIKLQDAMVTSTTNGLKIEVVSALPANPSNDTIYIIQ